MGKIWEFFGNMNELLYVSDMDSHELIYMNKKALALFGFDSVDELAGKKCYEVLYNNSAPCSGCNNQKLSEGDFLEGRYYSARQKKYMTVKDTLVMDQGRRCRVELALDDPPQEYLDHMACNYQNLEALANEGLRIALKASTPDECLDIILEYMGKALQGERTYIFEQNRQGGDDNTYEWVACGVTPEKDNLQNLPPEICANWYRNFSENKNIIIKDLEDIREEDPLQYENLKRQDIHSLVVVPLYDDEKVIGFYGVDNPPGQALEYAQNMLQIMAHFIVSSLKRRELVAQLQSMSYLDQLTQIGNRFAMDRFMAQMKTDESIGIVYCDITGLKRVNDTQGHEAGDRLIVRATESLERVFEGYGLFRIGGDELLALCPQITDELLEQKVVQLKKDMQEHSVTIAVGAVWEKDCKSGIDKLLSEADKRMYEDKKAYYNHAGVDRRM